MREAELFKMQGETHQEKKKKKSAENMKYCIFFSLAKEVQGNVYSFCTVKKIEVG